MKIEEYLEKPYWVIDVLPKQVPANSKGQYFKVEKYFLEHPYVDIIYRKFTNILLKLNCYDDMDYSFDGEQWVKNPVPKEIECMVMKCLSYKTILYIFLESADAVINIGGDDPYMTLYNPKEDILELLERLTTAEGLFIWKSSIVENQQCPNALL